jgi:hypothetical protein
MTRRFLFVVGLATWTMIIGGASTQAAAGATDVPFRGSFSGTTTATRGTPNTGSSNGTLSATYLGRGTYSFDWTGVVSGTSNSITGTLTFVAANGDALSAAVTGTGPLFPPVVGASGAFDFTLTISGGTGRFSDASGTLRATGTTEVTSLGTTSFTTADVGSLSGQISF